MTTPTNLPVAATVNFHGTELITIKKDELELVAMKPVVEGIGLDWKTQYRKIASDKRYGHMTIPLKTSGGDQKISCIPLVKLNGWLFTINPNKIPNIDVRKRVVEYQEECFIALYDYWHKGKAERLIEDNKTITPTEQHGISLAVKAKAGNNGKAIAEIWSRVHNKFKVAKYTQIPSDKFYDVVEYILSMELRAAPVAPAIAPYELIELERLRGKVELLEERSEYYQKSNDTYIALYRELLNTTLDVLCPNRKKLTV